MPPVGSQMEPGDSNRGSQDPQPSAPSLQVMQSKHRQPPTNPHFTPHVTTGHSAAVLTSHGGRSLRSGDPLSSGTAGGQPQQSGPGVSPQATNSNVNSNVSSGRLASPAQGSTSLPQQRQETGPHELVQGFSTQPASVPGVVVPPAPRRTSQRQASSRRTSLPQEGASRSRHGTSRFQGGIPQASLPRGNTQHQRVTSQPQGISPSGSSAGSIPHIQSMPFSRTQSQPYLASYTGDSEQSYTGRSEGSIFPGPSSVQDVPPNPSVSEIGQSEPATASLPSYHASFEVPSAVENQSLRIGGGGAPNGYHSYQATPPLQSQPHQNGTSYHQHGNRPEPPKLHPSMYPQSSAGLIQFVNQAGTPDEYNSIPAMVPAEEPATTVQQHRHSNRKSVLNKQEAVSHARARGAHMRAHGAYESINEPATSNPTHQSPQAVVENSHQNLSGSESGGAIAQCSEPSPNKALYPVLPGRTLRKRKAGNSDSEHEVSETMPAKRSKKLPMKKACKSDTECSDEEKVATAKSNYSFKGVFSNFLGKIMGKSGKQPMSSGDMQQQHSLDEDDDEDFHSCNEDEEKE